MAFCSYFKIQPVAGGADRIKKSEWKLVSHDNSQPPRERQLLVPLLSPDSASLPLLRCVSISLFPPSAYRACFPSLFLARSTNSSTPRYSFSYVPPLPSRPLLTPCRAILPIYLPFSRYLRYHHRHQPSLSPSSTALNIRQLYVCIYMYTVEYRRALCICRRYINIYANAHRCALIRIHMRGIARILLSSRALHN